jgi:hypothetical protein
VNTKTILLFGQPAWGAYMKLKLSQKGVNAEVMHLFYEDGTRKIIVQDEYGFDVERIVNEVDKDRKNY